MIRRLASVLSVAAVALALLILGFLAVTVPYSRAQAAFDRKVERRVAERLAQRGERR